MNRLRAIAAQRDKGQLPAAQVAITDETAAAE
jgi:hypothetical protein